MRNALVHFFPVSALLLFALAVSCTKNAVVLPLPEANTRWLCMKINGAANAVALSAAQTNEIIGIFSNDFRQLLKQHETYKDNFDRTYDKFVADGSLRRWLITASNIDRVLLPAQRNSFAPVVSGVSNFRGRTSVLLVQLLLTYQQAEAIDAAMPKFPRRPPNAPRTMPTPEQRSNMMAAFRKSTETINNILTPEQRKAYELFRKERGEDRMRMPGSTGGGSSSGSSRATSGDSEMPPPPPPGN